MSTKTTCIHELDVVRLREPAEGWREPGGQAVTWPVGTVGTVVIHAPGGTWCQVEVVADSGRTLGFIEPPAAAVEVTRPYRPETAARA